MASKSFCPDCGATANGGKFCPECGYSFPSLSTPLTHQSNAILNIEEEKIIVLNGNNTKNVKCVCVSSDNKRLASSDSESEPITIRIWEVEDDKNNWKEVRTMTGHAGLVYAMSFAGNNDEFLLTSSYDFTSICWNVHNGEKVHIYKGHSNFVCDLLLLPSKLSFATASEDYTMRIWSVANGQQIFKIDTESKCYALALSTDNKYIASGQCQPNNIIIWDFSASTDDNNYSIKKFKTITTNHAGYIWRVSYSKDGKFLASGSSDNTINIYHTKNNEYSYIKTLKGHTASIWAVIFTGDILVSAGKDKSIKFWDVEKGDCIKTISKHTDVVCYLAVSSDNSFVASASDDKTIMITKITNLSNNVTPLSSLHNNKNDNKYKEEEDKCTILQANGGSVTCACFSFDNKRIASGGTYDNPNVRLWEIDDNNTWKEIRVMKGHHHYIHKVCFAGLNDEYIISCSSDCTAICWNIDNGEKVHVFQGYNGDVLELLLLPNKLSFVTGSADGTIRICSIITGQQIGMIPTKAKCKCLALNNDKSRIAAGLSYSFSIMVWDASSFDDSNNIKNIKTISTDNYNWISGISYSGNNKFLASGSHDTTINIYNAENDEYSLMKTLKGHSNFVRSVTFIDDILISGSDDKTIKFWDIEKGECFKTITKHTAAVNSIVLSRDNSFILSGSDDQTMMIIDTRTLTEINSPTVRKCPMCGAGSSGKILCPVCGFPFSSLEAPSAAFTSYSLTSLPSNFKSENAKNKEAEKEYADKMPQLLKEKALCGHVKIVVGGEGRAGKSSTCRSLLGENFEENIDSTRGISIRQASLQLNQSSENQPKAIFSKDISESNNMKKAMALLLSQKGREEAKMIETMKKKTTIESNNNNINNNAVTTPVKASLPSTTSTNSTSSSSSATPSNPPQQSTPPAKPAALTKSSVPAATAIPIRKDNESLLPKMNLEEISSSISVPKTNNILSSSSSSTSSSLDVPSLLGKMTITLQDVEEAGKTRSINTIFYDCGGQDIYQSANELFFSKKSLVLLLFDMKEMSQSRNTDILERWFHNIFLHTPMSPILLIGTRGDMCAGSIANDINILLKSKFEKIPQYWKRIVRSSNNKDLCFFVVNNRLGKDDKGIQDLQAMIARTINEDEIFKETYPVAWLKILDDIVKRKDEEITMSLGDFEKNITSQYGIKGEQMIDDICSTFHELGFVAYFKDNSMKHVVLNPQKLIDGIACVISNAVSSNNPMYYQEIDDYNTKGIITRRLLYHLWENASNLKLSTQECEVFCKFLLKLNLMVEESDNKNSKAEDMRFIVPAMLPKSNDRISSDYMNVRKIAYFNLIDKNSKSPVYPLGVFYRLLAKTCAVTQLTSNFKPIMSRTEAIVAVAETHVHVISDPRHSRIKLVIDSKYPSGIIYMFEIYFGEVARDYFPEMGYQIMMEVMLGTSRNFLNLMDARESVRSGKTIYATDLEDRQNMVKKEQFGEWFASHAAEKYDIFLSYRVNPDSNRMNLLHWCLLNGTFQYENESRLPSVFLDQYCLEKGLMWDLSFATALKNSTVFCPLITDGNLEMMRRKLNENNGNMVDNVLLEWMLAIELYEAKIIRGILPLFEREAMYTKEKGAISISLNKKTTETNKSVLNFLKELQISSIESSKILERTASETFDTLCRFQAISLDKFQSYVSGSYTDWKLYMQCAGEVRNHCIPFVNEEWKSKKNVSVTVNVANNSNNSNDKNNSNLNNSSRDMNNNTNNIAADNNSVSSNNITANNNTSNVTKKKRCFII